MPLAAAEEFVKAAELPILVPAQAVTHAYVSPVPDSPEDTRPEPVFDEIEQAPVEARPVVNPATVTVTAEIPVPSEAPPPAEETLVPAPTVVSLAPPSGEMSGDIGKALESSGLVMIETRSEKPQAEPPEAAEKPAPRPHRRRAAPSAVAEETLVMVETRHPEDLRID